MASNDGSRLTVFSLTFRQHDNRQMQQILRAYGHLPSNPGNRAHLYTSLFDLSKSLGHNEILEIESWLQNGGIPGDFPTPSNPGTPFNSTSKRATKEIWSEEEDDVEVEVESQGEWPEYNLAAFESANSDMEGIQLHGDDEPIDTFQLNDQEFAAEVPHTGDELLNDNEISDSELVDVDSRPPQILYEEIENSENECQVCYEVMASVDLLAPPKLTSTCDHKEDRRSCLPCLAEHINIALDRFALHAINCPFCDETLSYEEIKEYATPAGLARYERLLFVSNPNIVMCLGPSCDAGQTHIDTTNPKMICNTCSFATCVNHKLPWHEDLTCKEFDCDERQIERLEEAEATAKLLAKDQSKICPSCKQGVTKQDGCDHLSCLCGKSWCFVCLASWDNIIRIGNEGHALTCDYHPRRRQKSKAQQVAGEAQMKESLLGGPASQALLKARDARNERIRAELRPKALEAAEARMKADRERSREDKSQSLETRKRKIRLLPAWEER